MVETGQPADALYFIKAGEVVCHVSEDGKKKELMRLKEGGVIRYAYTLYADTCIHIHTRQI